MKTKKLLICLILGLILLLGFAACNEADNADAPDIAPASAVYEISSSDELTFDVNLKDFMFTSIMRGETALTISNYNLKDGTLTINADYLKTLSLGKHVFTLVSSGGETDFTITVVSNKEPFIAQPNLTYNKAAGRNDLDVRIDLKGLRIERLTYGDDELVANEEYETDDAGLFILADYMYNLPVGNHTFVVYTPGGSIDFTVRVI